jgi:class 3 adenylate cyclase/predicted ATPase
MGSKFCNQCGAALSDETSAEVVPQDEKIVEQKPAEVTAALEGERRQLTLMFCDMVGSTELATRLDPEDMREVLRAYQDCCDAIAEGFRGKIVQYLGDGVLMYFGYPQAQEDAAEQAVRAALALIQAVDTLQMYGTTLRTRIGIATGMVVVGDLIEAGDNKELTAIGETPNLAARLQSLAEPNSVVISDLTRRLVNDLFEYRDLGRHSLKGFEAPVRAWLVTNVRGTDSHLEESPVTAGQTQLLGRKDEIDQLLSCVQRTRSGQGQVVLLCGEPGIGKSRVSQALRERLGGEFTVLRYFCSPHYRNTALYPVIDQLQRAAGFEPDDPTQRKLDKLETLLARALNNVSEATPLCAALLSLPTGGRYPPLNLNPKLQKQQTLHMLEAWLNGLAARGPVLAILENAHWLDPTTQEWIGRIIERINTMPVLWMISYRPEFVPPWKNRPYISTMTLTRLNRVTSGQIIDQLCDGKPLPPQVLEQILEKTDGVPLFVEELTKAVLEADYLDDAGDRYVLKGVLPPLAVPSTLQDSLMARLDQLASVKEIIQIGATIGRQFTYELLAQLTRFKEKALIDALEQLIAADLIYAHGKPPRATYIFKHALIQDAAYGSQLRGKRQTLHVRIAKMLEERFPERVRTEPELLAQHYNGAGLTNEALGYWLKAGQRALARSAYREALAHINTAMAMLKDLPEGTERDQHELALQTLLGRISLATKGFSAAATGTAYARARELCSRLGETRQIFPVLYGIWTFHMVRADHATAMEVAQECLQRAHHSEDTAALLMGYRIVGSSYFIAGDCKAAREHLEKALTLYRPHMHNDSVFDYGNDYKTGILDFLSQTLFALGYPDQAQAIATEALHHAEQLDHAYTLGYALHWCNLIAIHRREPGIVQEQAQRLLRLSSDQGFSYWLGMANFQMGSALVEQGEADKAIPLIEQGIAGHRSAGSAIVLPMMLYFLARAYTRAGRLTQATEPLQEAIDQAQSTGEHWFLAELQRFQGELLMLIEPASIERAEALFQQALTLAQRQHAKAWQLRAAISLARLWWQQGKTDSALELLRSIYRQFEEGFATADLVEAKQLLDNWQESIQVAQYH